MFSENKIVQCLVTVAVPCVIVECLVTPVKSYICTLFNVLLLLLFNVLYTWCTVCLPDVHQLNSSNIISQILSQVICYHQ